MISRTEFHPTWGMICWYKFDGVEKLIGLVTKECGKETRYSFTPLDGNNRYRTFYHSSWKQAFDQADRYIPWSGELL